MTEIYFLVLYLTINCPVLLTVLWSIVPLVHLAHMDSYIHSLRNNFPCLII